MNAIRLDEAIWAGMARESVLPRSPYKRVVVKMRTRRTKRTNGKPMTHAAKVAGWNKAAAEYLRKCQKNVVLRKSSITFEEAVQIDTNSRAAAKRTAGKRLTAVDNLMGADFGLLLVWKLSSGGQVKEHVCFCACGNICDVAVGMLLNGRKRDCGCRLKARRRQQRCRKRQKLAKKGRKRAHWKRHWGMAA